MFKSDYVFRPGKLHSFIPASTSLSTSSLGIRPFAVRRKGLGTRVHPSCPQDGMLTWPIRIVDCKWCHGNGFSSGFQFRQWLDTANRCAVLCFTRVLDGRQRADRQRTCALFRHKSLITTHNCIPLGQLECGHVPRPFLLTLRRVWFRDYGHTWCRRLIAQQSCREYVITILGTHYRRPCTQYASRASYS